MGHSPSASSTTSTSSTGAGAVTLLQRKADSKAQVFYPQFCYIYKVHFQGRTMNALILVFFLSHFYFLNFSLK